ncbi:hypothetical protein [Herbiconiux sp. L3-i23]|uniref:hypothetical protein n=1 Tax=Herbiconiux sp. L3-i23 TaxID=2905871 RepID=UPI00205D4AE4|nr:hypothetical protein [Herbiconiux sp. L3-i23]BDI21444.1 hypothetical protein L3i23_02200 [Herbiconiux sp. L3-i23]
MRSFTPGRPVFSLVFGLIALILGVALIPFAIEMARGEYGLHFWWLVMAPIAGGLYFAIAGAVALIRRGSQS